MLYYLLYAVIYLLSILPFSVLYLISDLGRWIVFGLFRYRKDIITDNLKQSFPELSASAILQIKKEFEQSFCDQWIELIKLLSISPKSLQKRVSMDTSLFEQYAQEGKSCSLMLGHQFNWEWGASTLQLNVSQDLVGYFMPQKPEGLNRLIIKIRSRMGVKLIDVTQIKALKNKFADGVHIKGLISDQVPGNTTTSRWYRFLNRPCPFTTGPEKVSVKNGLAVVYCSIIKQKRGHYQVVYKEICPDASAVPEYFITDRFVQLLQSSIQKQPANWLWSHRRWKRVLPENTIVQDL